MNAKEVRAAAVPYENVTGWRWPNFTPREVACRGTGRVPDPARCLQFATAMDRLQALREQFGHPLIVNSGYRTPEHNRSIPGAAPKSKHTLGIAFDVSIPNVEPHGFEAAARAGGFRGIGRYPNPGGERFIHIDTRATPATWGGEWPADADRFDRHSENPDGTAGVIQRAIRNAKRRLLAWLAGGGSIALVVEYATNTVHHVGDWLRGLSFTLPSMQTLGIVAVVLLLAFATLSTIRNRSNPDDATEDDSHEGIRSTGHATPAPPVLAGKQIQHQTGGRGGADLSAADPDGWRV